MEEWFTRLTQQAPRANFLPARQRRYADEDRPLPIGHGSTNSQPSTVATMLQLLDVQPGDRVLDVGAGSGWTTCLMAVQAGPGGSVVGVEVDERVAAFGAANVTEWVTTLGHGAAAVTYAQAMPGVLGWPQHAPYQRILVSAMADQVPTALVDQLAPGGVMVAPVAGRMARVRRSTDPHHDQPDVDYTGWYRFVPLQ